MGRFFQVEPPFGSNFQFGECAKLKIADVAHLSVTIARHKIRKLARKIPPEMPPFVPSFVLANLKNFL